MPPDSTPSVASPGLLSLRRNAASIWLKRKSGNTTLMGRRYCCASTYSASSAPKNISTGRSKRIMPIHDSAASSTEPMMAAVKYSFSLPPRFMLNMTLPPMPMSSPRLYMMFHTGAMTASAAVPSGP